MKMRLFASGLLFVSAMPGIARAHWNMPEISPADMSSALALFVGGTLMLTDRLRHR